MRLIDAHTHSHLRGPEDLAAMAQAPSDPLALPRVAAHLRQAGLDPDAIAKVTGANARHLFGF